MTKEQGKIKQIPPFSSESFRAYGSRTVGDSLLGQVCGTTRYGGNSTSHNQPPPSSAKHYFSHNQDQEARREPPPPVASPRRKGLGRASSRKHVAAWQAALRRKPGLGTRCHQGFRPPPFRFTPASFCSPGRSQRAGKERWTPTMGGRLEDTACPGPQGRGGRLQSNSHQPKGRAQRTVARL